VFWNNYKNSHLGVPLDDIEDSIINKLSDEITKSKAFEYYRRLNSFRESFTIYQSNYLELVKVFKIMKTPQMVLQVFDSQNREPLNNIQIETIRILHNYYASAETLIYLTRNRMGWWYSGTAIKEEYDRYIQKNFEKNGLAKFITDLRNYSLHYNLPRISSKATIKGTENLDHVFFIRKDSIITWKKWTSDAKMFIRKQDNEIYIELCTQEYYQLTEELHTWLFNRIKTEHYTDLDWLINRSAELNIMINTVFSK
jgi:hypothetical protein